MSLSKLLTEKTGISISLVVLLIGLSITVFGFFETKGQAHEVTARLDEKNTDQDARIDHLDGHLDRIDDKLDKIYSRMGKQGR